MTTPVYGHDGAVEESSNLQPGDKILLQFDDQIVDIGLVFTGDKRINFVEVNFEANPVLDVKELDNSIGGINVYPNPFSDEINLAFRLNKEGRVSVRVLNSQGQLVELIQQETFMQTGEHAVYWKNNSLSQGVYFIQFTMNGLPSAILPVVKQE